MIASESAEPGCSETKFVQRVCTLVEGLRFKEGKTTAVANIVNDERLL
jgi:hypothetical protein